MSTLSIYKRQLSLLLWKNFKLKRSRMVGTILEIVFPAVVFMVMVYARNKTEEYKIQMCTRPLNAWETRCEWDSFSPADMPNAMQETCKNGWVMGYTPSEAVDVVTAAVGVIEGYGSTVVATGFASEQALLDAFESSDGYDLEGCRVGVVFHDFNSTSSASNSYSLRFEATPGGYQKETKSDGSTDIPAGGAKAFLPGRTWLTDTSFPFFEFAGPRDDLELYAPTKPDAYGNAPGYYDFGYLMWQHALSTAFLSVAGIESDLFANIKLQRMPYPEYTEDYFIMAIQFGLPILLMLALLFSVLAIARSVTDEKAKGLKIALLMVGVPNWLHWMGYFLTQLVILVIAIIPITFELAFTTVLPNTQTGLFFVFLLLYVMATISFSFFISTLFQKASTAAAGAGIAWFLSYFPYFFVFPRFVETSSVIKHLVSLLPNTAVAMGANIIALKESSGEGLTWSTYQNRLSQHDPFSFNSVLWMLAFDVVMYLALAMYIDQLNPGRYGIPRPWYFPIEPVIRFVQSKTGYLPSFVRQNDKESKEVMEEDDEASAPLLSHQKSRTANYSSSKSSPSVTSATQNQAFVNEFAVSSSSVQREAEPSDVAIGIAFKGLKKTFNKFTAVEDVTLNVFKGSITALLGHNGAGKTTTMRMLCGMFKPTSGSVTVNGENVATNTEAAQRQIGFCPQHDTLYDELTILEHLWFFCCLRGAPRSVAEEHAMKMTLDLDLGEKQNSLASKLSGGQRRRLSVGLALIGDSRVVVLDEPTTGMDPTARRITWGLLERCKQDRAMLVSTHFMDEADFIGDRVAIMAEGRIRCDGSSLFLKQKYGSGYKLTILKVSQDTDSAAIIELIKKFCPAAVVSNDMGCELSMCLGPGGDSNLAPLFQSLDANKINLGVLSYGCSVTTLEDVFIKVGEIVKKEQANEELNKCFDPCDKLTTEQARRFSRLVRSARSEEILSKVGLDIKAAVESGSLDQLNDVSMLRQQYTKQVAYLEGMKQRVTGWPLMKSQWKAVFFKKMRTTFRDKYHLSMQVLPPVLFTLLVLLTVVTSPQPEDLPPRAMNSLAEEYGSNMNEMPIWVTPSVSDEMIATLQDQVGASAKVEKIDSDDVGSWVLNQTSNSTYGAMVFNRQTPLIVDVDEDGVLTGWYNGQGYHTVAEAHATLASAIYGLNVGNATILTGNDPLPRTTNERAKQQSLDRVGFAISFAVMFGFAPLASSFVVPVVKEVQSKVKHLQFVTGITPFVYWSATFALDALVFSMGSFGSLILFPLFGVEAFSGGRFFILWLMYLLYGLAVIPLMYLCSFMFKSPSVAFVRLTMLNIFTGLGALTVISVLDSSDPESADHWRSIFIMLPNYNMAQAMNDLYTNFQTQQIVAAPCRALGIAVDQCCSEIEKELLDLEVDVQVQCTTNYFRWEAPGLGQYMTMLIIQALVFPLLVWGVEQGLRFKSVINRKWAQYFPAKEGYDSGQTDDVDVVREKEQAATAAAGLAREDMFTPYSNRRNPRRARSNKGKNMRSHPTMSHTDGQVVLDAVSKDYNTTLMCSKQTHAVVNLSLKVSGGESFGLLGTNGAGKTTTFKLLTGDLGLSTGSGWVGGHSLMNEMHQIHKNIGYCPQFDALFDLMTGRETLQFFCRLQGIPFHIIAPTVNRLVVELGLSEHENKITKDYSGGTKRKLNTAIALLGDPAVILLDEPTSGMDPVARQMLGKALLNVQEAGSTIMLTSHSMEECEALCTRMGIMIKGHLSCIGSPQHLRSRFGDHFTVTFRRPVDCERENECWTSIQTQFPDSKMKNCNARTMQIGIPYENKGTGERTSLGTVFKVFQHYREINLVDEFAVSEATLNQIFMDIAMGADGETKRIANLEEQAYV